MTERSCPIGTAGIPPLAGTHMSVWCNRWYNEGFTALVLITGWEFFCIKIQKGTGHVSIRDVVKLKNTTSPNKKEEEEMYQKVSTDLSL